MIFRRKKQTAAPSGPPVLRGRGSVENDDNPLARRFHPDDEPDTIDLLQPATFHAEPDTAELAAKRSAPDHLGVVTLAAGTGKLYAQPGKGDPVVYLDGEAVRAPTELRPGDRVRIGNFELQLTRTAEKN
jgi:hypothetical protein